MRVDNTKQFKGPKQKTGRLVVAPEGLQVFVGYCPNDRCKIFFTLPEAKEFARKYYRRSRSVKQKLLKYLIKQLR